MSGNRLVPKLAAAGRDVVPAQLADAVPDVAPFDESSPREIPAEAKAQSAFGLVELLLKSPAEVDRLNRDPGWQAELFTRFLLIGEIGYLVYAVVMLLVFNLAPPAAYPSGGWLPLPYASWLDTSGLGFVAAYTLGVLLSACVCLPSFYFYSLLAGVKMTWLQITGLIARGTAASAILLLGVLPIYVALVLGLIVLEAPAPALQWALRIGLLLPFPVGLWGLRSIYLGVLDLSADLTGEWQCRRLCFLRRLVLSWTGVYAVVLPVMIYRLWEMLASR